MQFAVVGDCPAGYEEGNRCEVGSGGPALLFTGAIRILILAPGPFLIGQRRPGFILLKRWNGPFIPILTQLSMVIEHHYSDLFQATSTALRKPFLVPGYGKAPALWVNVNIAYNVYMNTVTPLGRPISVRLPEDLRERVEALAKATRRSLGDVVREVLERDLSELEWEQRIVARAADLRSGRAQSVPLAVIERELGLDDALADASILDEIE